ncbi:MAG TPA: hypothetical protein VE991_07520 [Acidimicrobiales bacterium]|nr:hypothetical protein [Acidimicrobiales bacterium]
MRRLLAFCMVLLPSGLKRHLGRWFFGWDIHPTAYLGRSLVMVNRLVMGPGSSIGPFNVIRDLEELRLDEGASIAARNWIAGFPLDSPHFPNSPNRDPSLVLGKGAMITVGHEIDCADRVEIGDHAGLAGFRCTVLTHSLDLVRDRFVTQPVEVGHHTAIMTDVVLLNGTRVPPRCIVSAGSVVNTRLTEELTFYCGNPAEATRTLPATLKYFRRGEAKLDDATKSELETAAGEPAS